MFTYNLAESETIPEEIFEKAIAEPVMIRSSQVLLSASTYTALVDKIAALEDELWGKRALAARETDRSIGHESFTQTLQELALGEA